MTNRTVYLLFLGATLVFSTCLALIGDTPWTLAWQGALLRLGGESGWSCLLEERIPRIIVILCSGASLAVSGAVTQSLFQNPLASPSVLGIPFGGSFCVTLVFITGLHYRWPFTIPLAASVGSFLILLIVTRLSTREGRLELPMLILNGIALSTVLITVQKTLLYTLRDHWTLIQTLTEWEAGSTSDRSWLHVQMQLPLTIIGLYGCFSYRRELNILALGDEEAEALGVDVSQIRRHLFLSIALLVGGSLAGMGMIAFFGLLLPHLLRKIWGADMQFLLPLSLLAGAAGLSGLELLLRANNIHILTIGTISSLVGALFFLLLLLEQKKLTRNLT
jgi:iron complex transport system permease protein